jgi:hypothetical protein
MREVSETYRGLLMRLESAPLKTSCHRKPSVVTIKIFCVVVTWLKQMLNDASKKTLKVVFIEEGFAKKEMADD